MTQQLTSYQFPSPNISLKNKNSCSGKGECEEGHNLGGNNLIDDNKQAWPRCFILFIVIWTLLILPVCIFSNSLWARIPAPSHSLCDGAGILWSISFFLFFSLSPLIGDTRETEFLWTLIF